MKRPRRPRERAHEEVLSFDEIERLVADHERTERRRLGLDEDAPEPWHDPNPQRFLRADRATTTLLIGGLTVAQDRLAAAAFRGLGYRVEPLDCPDTTALHLGKEFGNRGQCNPTYFTVGNLLQRLRALRDDEGLSVDEIVQRYVFLTAGACGPCRFGTYATEYRKALRDAGFEGFRVLLFQQQGGLRQATGRDSGLDFTPSFFLAMLRALIAGDVVNAMGYRTRPYEVRTGATDRAIETTVHWLEATLERRRSVLWTLRRARRLFAAIEVDRLRAKPKVQVIGEFWAMTTEGDGNYRLQRFLEAEGAEVEAQPVAAWLLYMIWQVRHDTLRRLDLRSADAGCRGLLGKRPGRVLRSLWLAERGVRLVFGAYARALGLGGCPLPDMDRIARNADGLYDTELRGGEGHMEVGKLVEAARGRKAHLVVSVKPFGCMPSSGVSDGVQSKVEELFPHAAFCSVETSGDGEVHFQSRLLLHLHRAHRAARAELDAALDDAGWALDEIRDLARPHHRRATWHPACSGTGTAANLVREFRPRVRELKG